MNFRLDEDGVFIKRGSVVSTQITKIEGNREVDDVFALIINLESGQSMLIQRKDYNDINKIKTDLINFEIDSNIKMEE